MQEFKDFLQRLLATKNIDCSGKKQSVFDNFIQEEDNQFSYSQIAVNQKILISRFMSKIKLFEISNCYYQIPNGTVKKEYKHIIDVATIGGGAIIATQFEDIEKYGLAYDASTATLSGIPTQGGDFKIQLQFQLDGDTNTWHSKPLTLIINADPKSLWKDIASDSNDKFWKEDNVSEVQALGEKTIVVSSKRGRSHANVGSFRDDDYGFKYFAETGWNVVVVSDGAGSAKASRKGSAIACNEIINYVETNLTVEVTTEFDALIKKLHEERSTVKVDDIINDALNSTEEEQAPAEEKIEIDTETTGSKLNKFIYNYMGNAAKAAHTALDNFATSNEINLKDLHSTLIFTLFKKYEFGYVVLSFGVGDCPIAVINKDCTDFKLMNWLDVGEFGGGTRFITMPEIFVSDKFKTRFGFKLIEDFSYLILMTDGIYDPKFVVEANLEKLEKWNEFLADLNGENDNKSKVVFDKDNTEIANQLNTWMDFWSPGNHDDRTLAIVF